MVLCVLIDLFTCFDWVLKMDQLRNLIGNEDRNLKGKKVLKSSVANIFIVSKQKQEFFFKVS